MEKKTILVIEDNELNLKLVKSLLQIGNYHVIDAKNARTGIDLAREQKPDLILMDIQLPGMDGFTATKVIREDPDLNDIPVVALTAHAMPGDNKKAYDAGCDEYICKPINTRGFLEKINELSESNIKGGIWRSKEDVTHKYTVLIADDNKLTADLIAAKLSPKSYEVIKAYGGTEAIEKAFDHAPDVIILDITKSDLDSLGITTVLKNNMKTKHIPIILIISVENMDYKARGNEAGADEFLTKPINSSELLLRIYSVLRFRQYMDQTIIHDLSMQSLSASPTSREEPLKTDVPYSILIVQGDAETTQLIQTSLSDSSFKLSVVTNGNDALRHIQRENTDLILLDVQLPDTDGFELCKNLKKNSQTKSIQIVLMTDLKNLESKSRNSCFSPDDYLVKPVSSQEISARITMSLRKKTYVDKLNANYQKALELSFIDERTGIYNHYYFKRFLGLEITRSLRYEYPIALTKIEIDYFNKLSDNLKSIDRDSFLRECAQIIKKNVRDTDLVALLHDETFAVLLPYVDATRVPFISGRIRSVIIELAQSVTSIQHAQEIHVNIGIALCPSDTTDPEVLIRKAHDALCQAKNV